MMTTKDKQILSHCVGLVYPLWIDTRENHQTFYPGTYLLELNNE